MSVTNARGMNPSKMLSKCANCDKDLGDGALSFEGVICCRDCYKIADFKLQRCRKELQMTFTTYKSMLRLALIRKQLQLPVIPEGATSADEIVTEFEKLVKEIDGQVKATP